MKPNCGVVTTRWLYNRFHRSRFTDQALRLKSTGFVNNVGFLVTYKQPTSYLQRASRSIRDVTIYHSCDRVVSFSRKNPYCIGRNGMDVPPYVLVGRDCRVGRAYRTLNRKIRMRTASPYNAYCWNGTAHWSPQANCIRSLGNDKDHSVFVTSAGVQAVLNAERFPECLRKLKDY